MPLMRDLASPAGKLAAGLHVPAHSSKVSNFSDPPNSPLLSGSGSNGVALSDATSHNINEPSLQCSASARGRTMLLDFEAARRKGTTFGDLVDSMKRVIGCSPKKAQSTPERIRGVYRKELEEITKIMTNCTPAQAIRKATEAKNDLTKKTSRLEASEMRLKAAESSHRPRKPQGEEVDEPVIKKQLIVWEPERCHEQAAQSTKTHNPKGRQPERSGFKNRPALPQLLEEATFSKMPHNSISENSYVTCRCPDPLFDIHGCIHCEADKVMGELLKNNAVPTGTVNEGQAAAPAALRLEQPHMTSQTKHVSKTMKVSSHKIFGQADIFAQTGDLVASNAKAFKETEIDQVDDENWEML